MRVAGKTALITGAASGIGEGIARKLAAEGARVVVADLNESGGERVVRELQAQGGTAHFAHLDVASETSWEALRPLFDEQFAPLDIVVNAAGVLARKGHPFDEITLDEWRRVQSVNLDGVFLGTRFGVSVMKRWRRGSIINIGSIAGTAASRGGAAYGASKGGVHNLTKQAAFSAAKAGYGVRVNSILPGYVWTPAMAPRAIAEHGSEEAARRALAARHPINIAVDVEDVAWAALYLASDEARVVTGTELVVDGGILATLWGVN